MAVFFLVFDRVDRGFDWDSYPDQAAVLVVGGHWAIVAFDGVLRDGGGVFAVVAGCPDYASSMGILGMFFGYFFAWALYPAVLDLEV